MCLWGGVLFFVAAAKPQALLVLLAVPSVVVPLAVPVSVSPFFCLSPFFPGMLPCDSPRHVAVLVPLTSRDDICMHAHVYTQCQLQLCSSQGQHDIHAYYRAVTSRQWAAAVSCTLRQLFGGSFCGSSGN